jgi:hypothetical protein
MADILCYVFACCMAVFVFVNVSYFPFSHVLDCNVLVWVWIKLKMAEDVFLLCYAIEYIYL